MAPEEAYSDEDAELLAQMRQDFLEECRDFLDQLSLNLAKLEEQPDDKEVINEIFRLAHTIKGSAAFAGLDEMRRLAHKMEDVFGVVRENRLEVNPPLIDLMYESLTLLTTLRDRAAAGDETAVEVGPLAARLESAARLKGVIGKEKKAPAAPAEKKEKPPAEEEEPPIPPKAETRPRSTVKQPPPVLVESVKVKTKRLDWLLNMVSELITVKNRVADLASAVDNEHLKAAAAQMHRTVNDIYHQIMQIRMVPLEKLFNKFPGVVRNLARQHQKDVVLKIEGKETELDKTVIEQLYDPLVHLLRNAVDHGIEEPDKRRARGKPPRGTITIKAYYKHNGVEVRVADDGRGMDPAKLKQSAVKKGLLAPADAENLTDEQAFNLIYLPGFSTSAKISDISGRGVGMNVVSEHVSQLRGSIKVRSVVDKGTTFIIQLPLTLALLQVLLVAVDGYRYALPIDDVVETVTIKPAEVKRMEKGNVIFYRGEALPLRSLSEIINPGRRLDSELGAFAKKARFRKFAVKDSMIVIVTELAGGKYALEVDYLVGKSDIVLKPLGDYLGRVTGVKGGSVLADGSVTLILDLAELAA